MGLQQDIIENIKELVIGRNVWVILSVIISMFGPYFLGKYKEKTKKVNEMLPIILQEYVSPMYNDLVNTDMNNIDEIRKFIDKYAEKESLYKISEPSIIHGFYHTRILLK
ncbi:hypothetical protein JFL43_01120 [Viridibacillus sp. YIM B01967]|uniref:Uncharacterized protein n=1 Tax=Viridibacillus soli TaxID=2798301 RepID=A0ABS1H273_9BACL|nr:hypothetical protein [Viridibacillus soli]MBK3493489.1 hypothetical protein [Viridibacillus soli]